MGAASFLKLHGNGNDFILLDNRGAVPLDSLPEIAARLCKRRISVGADGLLVLCPREQGMYRMRIFNADGSEAPMCGNGARCFAAALRYLDLEGDTMSFITAGGVMQAEFSGDFCSVDIGPIDMDGAWFCEKSEECHNFGAQHWAFLHVARVPHCVVWMDMEPCPDEARRIGRILRNHRRFPHGANVNFVSGAGDGRINVLTYERGVEDLTLSCGTGSTAAGVVYLGRAPGTVDAVTPGGINSVTLTEKGGTLHARLGGHAEVVAEGVVFL